MESVERGAVERSPLRHWQAGRAAGLDVSSATSDRRSSELTSSENMQELRGELGAVALAGETTEPAIYIFLSVLL